MKYEVTYYLNGELLWTFQSSRMIEAAWIFNEQSKKVGAESVEHETGVLTCETESKKLIFKQL